jgi:Ca2+-binding EF-hand superfamily protein
MSGKRADLYKLIDANRDGTIGLDELARYINTFGPALTKPEVDLMMKMIGMENK